MTQETRRNIFRYGIAIDLVILATGVAMMFPMSARALVVMYVGAVALTIWKGGWKGGLAALVLSMLALGSMFSPQIGAAQLIELTGAAIAAGAIISAAQVPRSPVIQPSPVMLRSNVVAFAAPPVEPPRLDPEEVAKESLERHRLARVLEKTAAMQIDTLRRDTERARREAEEAAAREREAAERAVQDEARRLAEEQRRAAEAEVAQRAEAEHRASEARERERME